MSVARVQLILGVSGQWRISVLLIRPRLAWMPLRLQTDASVMVDTAAKAIFATGVLWTVGALVAMSSVVVCLIALETQQLLLGLPTLMTASVSRGSCIQKTLGDVNPMGRGPSSQGGHLLHAQIRTCGCHPAAT